MKNKLKKTSPQKTFLYGKNSVRERIKCNPESIKVVFFQDGFNDEELVSLVKANKIPYSYITIKEMLKMKNAERMQGIIAQVHSFQYTPIEDILCSKEQPNIVFLDGLFDPHNVGTIIRTAACFGNIAICLPEHNACNITDTVLHVASGGENYVPIAKVTNFGNALREAKDRGYWIVGTTVDSDKEIKEDMLPFPLCLIMGSEGKGMSPSLKKMIDLEVTIPMEGAPLSFNVAMAASIFCYEIAKQSKKKK